MSGYTSVVYPRVSASRHADTPYPKMNPVVRDMWADELESGNYLQGTCHLVSTCRNQCGCDARYCCLGVLCELAVRAGILEFDENEDNFYAIDPAGHVYDRVTNALPEVVARWAGLASSDPRVRYHFHSSDDEEVGHPSLSIRLSEVNDIRKQDFGRIAQLIRRDL